MADRTETISIRVTVDELRALDREARRAKMTRTSYLLDGKTEHGAGELARYRKSASAIRRLLERAIKVLP